MSSRSPTLFDMEYFTLRRLATLYMNITQYNEDGR